MLRHALRRLLWVFPSVVGVSLISFFVLSQIPALGHEALGEQVGHGDGDLEAHRRSRFLDLPLFFNLRARDLPARVGMARDVIALGEPGTEAMDRGPDELARLGGAALPEILPTLADLPPDLQVRVTLALAPVAERMGLKHEGEPSNPAQVVPFWEHFWEAWGVEFRESTARSSVRRYARYGTEARAKELRTLDTFALPALMEALEVPAHAGEVAAARRLVDLVAHVAERSDTIRLGATVAEARACVERWQRWWMVYEADYVRLAGAGRVAAFALETRYGKWVFETVVLRLGRDAKGRPLLAELIASSRVTATVLLLGIALAYLFAVPLGTISALFRTRGLDRTICGLVLLPYALSPAAVGLLAIHFDALSSGSVLGAAALLGLVLVADPTHQQRAELVPVLAEDYVRAAIARGAGPLRVLFVHGLRNAMLPVVTRAALELPVAITACFVLEHVFGLSGLGRATLEAVRLHDTSWLMALSVTAAAVAVVSLVISDVSYAMLDPRLRHALMQRGRRRA
jgi:peptide/nickel transport system permease protein